MKHAPYDAKHARKLLPLLASIGREIQERTQSLADLEAAIERASERPGLDPHRMHALVAEAAAHRMGIRLARAELERLGCSVVGTEPLTFRIPGRIGDTRRSFFWRAGSTAVA